jgi:predicted phosphodiesterase
LIRIALFGGLYSNYLALQAALEETTRRGTDAIYCLGDMGAFGPHPDRVFPLLRDHGVQCIQGNYDDSVGNALDNCQCGYTDPRDNQFAQISYDYTLAKTSKEHREWLRALPCQRTISLGSRSVLLCHGSPRRVNEFLWESTTSTHFLETLADKFHTDVMCTTHTGIKWSRQISRNRWFVNVGVLGRPENDGQRNVWCTFLELHEDAQFVIDFVPIEYDYRRLANEMHVEGLPAEFIETVLTGWWTTCLEVLPAKERRRGKL